MLDVLTITFPFFALVLGGYLAVRAGLLPLPAIPGLNAFVLFFALPCLLYRFGAQTPIDQLPAVDATWVERAIWRCTEVVPGSLMRISRARRRARQSESYPAKARTGDGSGLVLCVPKQSPQNTVHLYGVSL